MTAGRTTGWVLCAVLAAGCTEHASATAGARGPVGPVRPPSLTEVTPTPSPSAAPSSGAAKPPWPPSGVYVLAPDGALLPSAELTPGVADPKATVAQLCQAGSLDGMQHYTYGTKHQIFADYGIPWAARAAYRVDALVPLSLGGLPQHHNLWPVPIAGPHGVAEKDAVETRLRELVCSHKLPLATAQQALAQSWYAAKLRYGSGPQVSLAVTGKPCRTLGTRGVSKSGKALVCIRNAGGKTVWTIVAPPAHPGTPAAPKPTPVPGGTGRRAASTSASPKPHG